MSRNVLELFLNIEIAQPFTTRPNFGCGMGIKQTDVRVFISGEEL